MMYNNYAANLIAIILPVGTYYVKVVLAAYLAFWALE